MGIESLKKNLKKAINKSGGNVMKVKDLVPKNLKSAYNMEEKLEERL